MKDKKEDGGPAFPNMPADPTIENWDSGMSLRDFYAAAALISMRAHPANEQPQHIGDWSFKVADAMLEARKK